MSLMRRLPDLARPAGLALLVSLAAATAPAASVDYFLHLEGIDGEATATEGVGFEIRAFGETPTAILLVPAIQKVRDASARPSMARLACERALIPRVVIEARSSGGRETFLRYELTNVVVVDHALLGGGDGLPTEQLTLNFERARWTYMESGETVELDCSSGRCACIR